MPATDSTDRVNLTIPVEPELRDQVREYAKKEDRQLADFCRVALPERIARLSAAEQGGTLPPPSVQPLPQPAA